MSFYDHLFCKIFTFSSSPEPLCQFQPILQQNILKENQNCSNVGPCPFPRRDNSNIVCFFFGVYGPTREFFTHMETSPLPVLRLRGQRSNPLHHRRGNFLMCSDKMVYSPHKYIEKQGPLCHRFIEWVGYIHNYDIPWANLFLWLVNCISIFIQMVSVFGFLSVLLENFSFMW